jgi:hypothetical protein
MKDNIGCCFDWDIFDWDDDSWNCLSRKRRGNHRDHVVSFAKQVVAIIDFYFKLLTSNF